jgi:hypothetical protein
MTWDCKKYKNFLWLYNLQMIMKLDHKHIHQPVFQLRKFSIIKITSDQ